jgi:hypothetical protein
MELYLMPDFSSLLSKPVDDIKRPASLPAGTYFGTVKNFEVGESQEKKTPFVRFNFTLTHAGPDIDPADMAEVDLSKKQLRQDYYITPDAEYRLKEFLESMKIPSKGRTFQSMLPDAISQPVMLDVVQQLNQKDPTAPPYNNVRSCKGAQ